MSLKVDSVGFPAVVKEDYRAVYDKFLETEAVQSIPKEMRSLAFVSYMQELERGVKYTFDIELAPDVNVKLLRLFLRKHGVIYGLSVKAFTGTLHLDNNSFLNALLNPAFVGILRFENGKHSTVKKQLGFLTGTLFRELPKPFLTPKNIKTTLSSSIAWVRLMASPMLEMAVYREGKTDGIMLRYSLAFDQMFFYGGKESSIPKLQSNIKRQVMARRLYD